MVRCLQHRQFLVDDEPAHAQLQEGSGRDVVAIEERDEFTISDLERLVQIAGLRVQVVIARDVLAPGLIGKIAEFRAPAIIEQVDVELIGRPVHRHRRKHRLLDDSKRLVVGGDENIDGGPGPGVFGKRYGLPAQGPRGLHIPQQQHGERVKLGDHQAPSEEKVDRVRKANRRTDAPEHVAQRSGHRNHDHRDHRDAIDLHATHDECRADTEHQEKALLFEVKRHGEHQRQHRHGERQHDPLRERVGPHPGSARLAATRKQIVDQ